MIKSIFNIPTPEQLKGSDHVYNNRIDFLEYISKITPPNSTCIEIGVLHGDHAEDILNIIKPTKLFLVDPWAEGTENIQSKFLKEIQRGTVIPEKGFSYDVVNNFPDSFFDFIYIDACHKYDSVKSDLEKFLPKLKKQGTMCGHDYQICERKGFGVIQAVDEFVDEHSFKWLAVSAHTDWALKKA